ncbi:MFS transporter [Rugamonas sp. FT82W]|uniref:MFS transporter n=1 Tax=Duganella vulcania TaxID=2692166 RepID=A0A845G3E0_9BURK|nr:MFS transporter [Duganella vulcania]MYM87925.1 MFS transporter [Duganella vulcania]
MDDILPGGGKALAPLEGPRRRFAIGCVLLAMTLVVLDASVANVALPTIGRTLHVSAADSVLVVTAYQAALIMALLPCAALGESLGYRRIFMTGVAIFVSASLLCAASPSLPWLVAARFVQGLGGAAVMALGVALLRHAVSQEQLPKVIGWNALTVALASAAGPTVGAAILSVANWQWLFALNLPLGGLVFLAGYNLPRNAATGKPVDLISIAINGAGFAMLIWGAELLSNDPVRGLSLLAASGLAFTLLLKRELPRAMPFVPLDLLRSASFRFSMAASICCFAGQAAGMIALPFYLQHGLGLSTWMTGLYITPWPLAVALTAPVSSYLAERCSTSRLCAIGGTIMATGLAAAALWPLAGSPLPLVPILMVCGIGFGLFQVPNNHNMFLSVPRERSGAAGGMQGTARLIGQSSGAIVMALLFSANTSSAPRIGLGFGAGMVLLAALISARRAS